MFVVFEGGEGCGKSTQARLLADELVKRGISCLLTREPGGTPLAEGIRDIFKRVATHGDEPTPLAELHLVMAARAQHVQRIIEPALGAGRTVVCDRFLDSSYVYQGVRGKIAKSIIDAAAGPVLSGLVPTLTLVLDLPDGLSGERLSARRGTESKVSALAAADRLDAMAPAMHAIIARGFLELARTKAPYPNGAIPLRLVIDARGSPDDVFARVLAAVDGIPS